MTVNIPVNHFLIPSNNNSLSVTSWSVTGDFSLDKSYHGDYSISLVVWDAETMKPDSEEAVVVGEYSASMVKGGRLKNKIEGVQPQEVVSKVLQGTIGSTRERGARISSCELEYDDNIGWMTRRYFNPGFIVQHSQWIDSSSIVNTEKEKKDIFSMYQKLWDILSEGNLNEWIRLCLEKDTEVAKMTYTTIEKLWESSDLPSILSNTKVWKIVPIDFSTVNLDLVGNRKLVRLLTKDWKSVIYFENSVDKSHVVRIPIFLRKSKNGWIISR